MKRTTERLKGLVQAVLPGLIDADPRPTRTRTPRFRRDLSSSGPISGRMPIFDLETGAEIMSVVDEGANVTIYYENMDHDGHPQQLLPRQITREEYLQMLRRQPRIRERHRRNAY